MSNLKEIEKLEKRIEFAKEVKEYLDNKHRECYEIAARNNFISDAQDLKRTISNFEYLKEVLTLLTEKGIEVDKKYKITNDIYMSVVIDDYVSVEFSIEDYELLYNHFIGSYSGINEWLFHTVADTYNLYSGNSPFNYALGITTLEQYIECVENRPKDKFSLRRCTAEQVAKDIKQLIDFLTDKDNTVVKAIVRDLDFKFNNLKELAKEW